MKTNEILELERALHAIEQILSGRCADSEPVLGSDLTNLGDPPPSTREVVVHPLDGTAKTSQEGAAIHFCMTSAARLLAVTRLLMSGPVDCSPKDQDQRLRELVNEIRAGARFAYGAALFLLGQNTDPVPSTDGARRESIGDDKK